MFHTFKSRLYQVLNLLAMATVTWTTIAIFFALLLLS
jgi:hypothetical protein